MANVKISGIAAETTAADTDLLEIENVSAVSKSMTRANFLGGGTGAAPHEITGAKEFSGQVNIGNNWSANTTHEGLRVLTSHASDANNTSGCSVVHTVTGDLNAGGEAWGAVTQLALSSITGGTTNDLLPLNGVENVISYNPQSASTVKWTKCVEAFTNIQSGTITNAIGFNSQCNTSLDVGFPATITDFIGYRALGQSQAQGGTIGTYTGFLATHDGRAAASASYSNYTGVRVDNIDKGTSVSVSGTKKGIWLNGYGAGSDIVFGDSSEHSINPTSADLLTITAKTGMNLITARSSAITGPTAVTNQTITISGTSGANAVTAESHTINFNQSAATSGLLAGLYLASKFGGSGDQTGQVIGLYTKVFNTVISSIAVAKSINVGVANISIGGITKNYGIFVEEQTVGTTSYGIAINGENATGTGCNLVFGDAEDAGMWYDGTDFCLDTSIQGSGTLKLASSDNWVAENSGAATMPLLPSGASGTTAKWFKVKDDSGNVFYIPAVSAA